MVVLAPVAVDTVLVMNDVKRSEVCDDSSDDWRWRKEPEKDIESNLFEEN